VKLKKSQALALSCGLALMTGLAGWAGYPKESFAQSPPPACTCTQSQINVAFGTNVTISNCSCGAMQCVALSNVALQCARP
jgi:hypothetical protein